MRKLKWPLIILAFCLLTNVIQFFIQHKVSASKAERLTEEIATLQSTLDAIGPVVTCWTPAALTFSGQEITEADLVEQSIPESFINESFVMEKDELIGKYFKIALDPGTPITNDTIMEEEMDDTLREVDITGSRWPVGMKIGDYVDYRITYPKGEDFIVLSHLRVQSITNQSLKVYMTEAEQHRYQAALVDYFLNKNAGADLYLNKYVEPGIQKEAVVYYSVPSNIEATMLLDPNIVDKAEATLNKTIRPSIDNAIKNVDQDQGGLIAGGRSELNGKINNDYMIDQADKKEQGDNVAKDPVAGTAGDEPLVSDEEVIE